MADINTLTRNVIDRERTKLESVVQDYQKMCQEEIEQAKEKLNQEFADKKSKLEQEKQRQLDISLNSINLKKRDRGLEVKQDIIHQYIQDVESGLKELDAHQTKDFILGVVNQIPEQGNLELVLGQETRHKLGDLVNELNQGQVSVSEQNIPEAAGFVLVKGSHQYNYLFENLIRDFAPELQKMLVEKLFQS